jgi:DNA-binding MarR family transcriptional regulator
MEEAGYLRRRNDAGDQRSKRIDLTPRGRRAVTAIREIVAQVEREWAQRLGDTRFADLRELLAELNAVVAPSDASNDPSDRPRGRR